MLTDDLAPATEDDAPASEVGEPAFSVCIPNYNYGRYLGATIQSVLDQTYPRYEIVVCDNASTDNSVDVVTSFKSDRIRLRRNPYNVGFSHNLDRAVSHSRHPYVIMLSADDLMRPTALEEYARVIRALGEAASRALIASNIDWFNDEGQILHTTSRRELIAAQPDGELTTSIGDPGVAVFEGLPVFADVFPRLKVATPFCATAYSRALYERVGGYSSLHHTAPDAYFSYKALLSAGAKVAFVDRTLFGYRVHSSNQVNSDRRLKTLKIPIDHYVLALQFTDAELARACVKRRDVIASVIDQSCLKVGLTEIRDGDRQQAFRLLMFALAVHPATTLRNRNTYALAALLLTGPIAPPIARLLWRARARLSGFRTDGSAPAMGSPRSDG